MLVLAEKLVFRTVMKLELNAFGVLIRGRPILEIEALVSYS